PLPPAGPGPVGGSGERPLRPPLRPQLRGRGRGGTTRPGRGPGGGPAPGRPLVPRRLMGDEETEDALGRRHAWAAGPDPVRNAAGWLALGDDDLLFRIEALPPDHGEDLTLLEVVRSTR